MREEDFAEQKTEREYLSLNSHLFPKFQFVELVIVRYKK